MGEVDWDKIILPGWEDTSKEKIRGKYPIKPDFEDRVFRANAGSYVKETFKGIEEIISQLGLFENHMVVQDPIAHKLLKETEEYRRKLEDGIYSINYFQNRTKQIRERLDGWGVLYTLADFMPPELYNFPKMGTVARFSDHSSFYNFFNWYGNKREETGNNIDSSLLYEKLIENEATLSSR